MVVVLEVDVTVLEDVDVTVLEDVGVDVLVSDAVVRIADDAGRLGVNELLGLVVVVGARDGARDGSVVTVGELVIAVVVGPDAGSLGSTGDTVAVGGTDDEGAKSALMSPGNSDVASSSSVMGSTR